MTKHLKLAGRSFLLGLALFISMPTVQALAQNIQTYRDEIRQYQNRVEQIKTGDSSRYNTEMSQIASWIDESLILIGKDEVDKVKSLVLKIGVYVDFVEASMARDVAMRGAIEAETQLKALKAEYGKLDAQVQQLTAEEAILQEKLNSLKK